MTLFGLFFYFLECDSIQKQDLKVTKTYPKQYDHVPIKNLGFQECVFIIEHIPHKSSIKSRTTKRKFKLKIIKSGQKKEKQRKRCCYVKKYQVKTTT